MKYSPNPQQEYETTREPKTSPDELMTHRRTSKVTQAPKPLNQLKLTSEGIKLRPNLLKGINIFSKIFIGFHSKVLAKSNKKQLTLEDLFDVGEISSYEENTQKFLDLYQKLELRKSKKPDLKTVHNRLCRAKTWLIVLYYVFSLLFDVSLPFLLQLFISWMEEINPNWVEGLLLSLALSIAISLKFIFFKLSEFEMVILMCKILTCYAGLIFTKVLSIPSIYLKQIELGKLIRMMINDPLDISVHQKFFKFLVTVPFLTVFISMLLFFEIGILCLIIPATMLLLFVLQYLLNQFRAKKFRVYMKYADMRGTLLSESINGIRHVKFNTLEKNCAEKLKNCRSNEMKALFYYYVSHSLGILINDFAPTLCTIAVVFLDRIISGEYMRISKFFAVISFINSLVTPFKSIVVGLFVKSMKNIGMERIDHLLKLEVKEIYKSERAALPGEVEFQNYVGGYYSEEMISSLKLKVDPSTIAVNNISHKFENGKLYAIVGEVGSGKSSLLLACMNELIRKEGNLKINGRMAYIPQEAFLLNDTIRANILFGLKYEEENYLNTLARSKLLEDLKLLEGGDLTEIGERGINLSGGQKQRICLARALYCRADIYLIDDALSALDAEVGQSIFQNYIKNELKDKTVLLVTHASYLLDQMDEVLLMKKGEIILKGNFDEIKEKEEFLNYMSNLDEEEQIFNNRKNSYESAKEEKDEIINLEKEDDIENAKIELKQLLIKAEDAKKNRIEVGQLLIKEKISKGIPGLKYKKTFIKEFGWYWFVLLIFVVFLTILDLMVVQWLLTQLVQPESALSEKTWILILIGLLVAFVPLSAIIAYIFSSGNTRASLNLFVNLVKNILARKMEFFDTTPIGSVLSRGMSDIRELDIGLGYFSYYIYYAIIQLLLIIALASFSSPIVFFLFLPLVYLNYRFLKSFLGCHLDLQKLYQVAKGPTTSNLVEAVNGAVLINCYNQSSNLSKKFLTNMRNYMNVYTIKYFGMRWYLNRMEATTLIFFFVGTFSTFGIVAFNIEILYNTDALALMLTWMIVFVGLMNFTSFPVVRYFEGLASVERIDEYINFSDLERGLDTPGPKNSNWPETGRLEAKNVRVRYREGLPLVLKNLNFVIENNQKVGIVGRTGSGKSSVILALLRIIEPEGIKEKNSGFVLDGLNLKNLGIRSVREALTLIPQDPHLLAGTLRSNIDPMKEYSDEEIIEVLEKTNLFQNLNQTIKRKSKPLKNENSAEENVQELEKISEINILNFEIETSGSNLSQGQKQLICIARALIKKPKVLLMDEATANIDGKTDQTIKDLIKNEFGQSTILTIAHRLNTIISYDKILVLGDGEILEFDSPKKLLENGGVFRDLLKEGGEEFYKEMAGIVG